MRAFSFLSTLSLSSTLVFVVVFVVMKPLMMCTQQLARICFPLSPRVGWRQLFCLTNKCYLAYLN